MRYTTFSKYIAQLADTVNIRELLDKLADFLLQSGFAGGRAAGISVGRKTSPRGR